MYFDLIKIFLPTTVAFFLGIFLTPIATHFFYKYKMWKKYPRTNGSTNGDFKKIKNENDELNTPRVGGMIVWISALFTTVVFYLISIVFPGDATTKMNFLSRNQTLIPLATLIFASLIGLLDDMLQIFGRGVYSKDPLIYRKIKIACIIFIGLVISYWFYAKLEFTSIHIPFNGEIELGIWFIPFFIMVMLAVFSTSVVDGIDGLSGGIVATVFGAYSIIAFAHNQIDISAFCAVVAGGILSFLWFNVPPARFYMGETGMMGLTVTLSVVAFLTNSVLLLVVIAFPLVMTSLSVIIQIISYKFFNKKRVFRLAPLHHHFEAIGWSREKIVMRYWILSVIFAVIGVIIALIS